MLTTYQKAILEYLYRSSNRQATTSELYQVYLHYRKLKHDDNEFQWKETYHFLRCDFYSVLNRMKRRKLISHNYENHTIIALVDWKGAYER